MNSKDNKLSNFILPVYGNLLKWAVVILAGYQLLWGLLQYVIWDLPYIRYEKRACLALILVFVIYLALCAFAAPDRLRQLGRKMKKYCTYEQIFLAGLVVWYAISCLVRKNIDHPLCFKHNDNRLFITWTSAFILFPLAEMLGPKRIRQFWETMIHIMTGIYTPICVWAMIKYYQGVDVVLLSGEMLTTFNNASLMIGCNRNITSAMAAVMLALCLYMIILKKGWIRLTYIGAATVHALVMIVSNSRTSYIATLLMADMIIAVTVWNRLRAYCRSTGKRMSVFKQILITIAVVALCTVLISFLKNAIIKLTAQILNNKLKPRTNYSNLSGRKNVWRASIAVMTSNAANFIFGVTAAYVPNRLLETGLVTYPSRHAHNILLQIGASLGVPAMLLYAVFLILLCYRCAHILIEALRQRKNERISRSWIIAVIVLFLTVFGAVEVLTFSVNVLNLPVFYILTGWITALERHYKTC